MANNYEDIVREFYTSFRREFIDKLSWRFPTLRLVDAQNLYQDAFIAVYENLLANKVSERTQWKSYIMTIGFNLACKSLRDSKMVDLPAPEPGIFMDEELPLSANLEVQSILGKELSHTPDTCRLILKLFYYENLSMDEIAEEIGYKNAQTAKAKKSQCMTDFIKRVTEALKRAGYDIKPKGRNRNGKN
ncbi:MAG: sigma-70 family RNA polymerase sigma factor [Muribaculaceae bacterium]|nr:sigma-70 family RNA polymerase sigma factor [Muribaculaceae bacterium]